MFKIVLYEPEIAPNTGNIIRLCANTGAALHLIKPMGFQLDDKRLRRAGLDYHEFATIQTWSSLDTMLAAVDHGRIFAFSTKGQLRHTEVSYSSGDVLIFGPETRGLPTSILEGLGGLGGLGGAEGQSSAAKIVKIPMLPNSRSLNLANAVSVAIYEAWQQLDFTGASQ